jgi:hypothetical protein
MPINSPEFPSIWIRYHQTSLFPLCGWAMRPAQYDREGEISWADRWIARTEPTNLLEKITICPRQHLVVITLKRQPALLRCPNLLIRLRCLRIADDLRLVPAACTRGIY